MIRKLMGVIVCALWPCTNAYSQPEDPERALQMTKALMFFSRSVDTFYVETGCKRPGGFPAALTAESSAYVVERLGPTMTSKVKEALADPRGSKRDDLIQLGWLKQMEFPPGLNHPLELDKAYVKEFSCKYFGQVFFDRRSYFRIEFNKAARPSRP